MSTKHLLNESYTRTKRMTGVNPGTPQGFRQTLADKNAYSVYVKSLSEGLEGEQLDHFTELAETTRVALMENSMFQINPYETLTLPILRVFYPKLIAKELVNVMPIDKPDVVHGFIHAYFGRHGDTGHPHAFPSVDQDISKGLGTPTVTAAGQLDLPASAAGNIFDAIETSNPGAAGTLNANNSHIEKDLRIVRIWNVAIAGRTEDPAGAGPFSEFDNVDIRPDVDGNFSATIDGTGNVTADVLSGHVDFENGTIIMHTLSGNVLSVDLEAFIALEENQVNPTVRFEIEKIRMTAVDRRISAEWTINLEQDAKALFDVQLQSELVNIIGEQIALDIDREIINKLIATNASSNPASHQATFDKTPPGTFTWGPKLWYENIIPTLNNLSAQVYNTCLMGAANTMACNPLDAAIFESLNGFEYAGNSVDGGDVGYRSATVQGGKWKVLVSSIVPQGTVLMKYRSSDLARAAFVYAPYVPALLTPYPLGPIPSLTIMARYATKVVRNEALATLSIIESPPAP